MQEKVLLAWDIQKIVGQILPPKHLYKWCTSVATGFRLRQQMCLCMCLLSLRLCDTFWIYMGPSQKKHPCCPSQSLLTLLGLSCLRDATFQTYCGGHLFMHEVQCWPIWTLMGKFPQRWWNKRFIKAAGGYQQSSVLKCFLFNTATPGDAGVLLTDSSMSSFGFLHALK